MVAVLLAALAAPGPQADATATGRRTPGDVAPARDDPVLRQGMDSVVAESPAGSCLTVAVDGTVVYHHNGSQPVVPASTEKVITATVALDLLGGDHRFTTKVVAGARATRAGTVAGDLTLVGAGDPVLTSSIYRSVRHVRADRAVTLLDDLASNLAAKGVTRVTGRVVGDESRYDDARTVPSWPDRYVSQDQVGPLSALALDDGYLLRPVAGGFTRYRAADPAVAAAQTFTDVLRASGVQVDGEPVAGTAPDGARTLAAVRSAPLSQLVGDMLLHSDNQTGELLTKELGRAKGTGGTTAAGAAVISGWRNAHDTAPAGTVTVDGSGLDPGNRITCDELTALLDLGGRRGPVAAGLPVAGRTGTLAGRFQGSAAAGKLRAKTGSLMSVTALAGFVDLPEGQIATFTYVANGSPVTHQVLAAQDFLATLLATYRPPCAVRQDHAVLAPLGVYAAMPAALAGVPSMAAVLPGTLAALQVFAANFRPIADRCTALDQAATVTFDP